MKISILTKDLQAAIKKLNTITQKYEPYNICKQCLLQDYFLNGTSSFKRDVKYICEKYNLYYDVNIAERIISSENKDYKIGSYIKEISSLRQYIDKKFKDSIFVSNETYEVTEKSDLDFVNEDIIKLKRNIKKSINGDFNAHNKWMNCLRDALELREKLINSNKWEEKASKYRTDGKDMISLWEQKGEEIRNIKKYEVIGKPSITIKLDENYTIDGDTLIIPVKVNDKDCNIYGKRIDNEWVLPSGNTIKCN